MRDHLRSVRARITLAATIVTGVALLLAGSWLLRTVEHSLTDRLRADGDAQLEALSSAIEAGRSPTALGIESDPSKVATQVVRQGRVVASSPELQGVPSLDSISDGGNVTRIGRWAQGTAWADSAGVAVVSTTVDSQAGSLQLFAAVPLDSVRRSVDAVQEGLVVTFPLLVGAVALLAWLLAGRALRPVEAIRKEVEAITGSTLDRRVPMPRSGDEVSRLARTMNAMLDRLEDASLRQQRFVADASHELRSPVAAIRTELEVAQRTAAPGEWPQVAERLLAEEARLEAVIADLLMLASLDEGAARPASVPVDLAELAVEESRLHSSDEVPVEVVAPQPVVVHGSRVQLRRALANLLANASRHARSGVQLSVAERDGRARILVDDDGPGIAQADRERVFERFTRLDDHRSRGGPGGAGLGLSLVRTIAEAHGGQVHADTAPLGGARLVVDLPLS